MFNLSKNISSFSFAIVLISLTASPLLTTTSAHARDEQDSFKLIGIDSGPGDKFGFKVAGSGSLLVVGALNYNNQTGAAYAFDCFEGQECYERWKLSCPLGYDCKGFGTDISVDSESLDNSLIVVGAPNTSPSGKRNTRGGSVFAINCTQGGWNCSDWHVLTPRSLNQSSEFGSSTAILRTSRKGLEIAVGAPGGEAAYVFSCSDDLNCIETAILSDVKEMPNRFGSKVAISPSIIAVSAPHATFGEAQSQGAVSLFSCNRNTSPWSCKHLQRLTSNLGSGANFGKDMILTQENLLFVSAPGAIQGRGAVLIYNCSYLAAGTGGCSLLSQLNFDKSIKKLVSFGNSISYEKGKLAVSSLQSSSSGNIGVVSRYQCGFLKPGLFRCDQMNPVFSPDRMVNDLFGQSLVLLNGFLIIGAPNAVDSSELPKGAAYGFQFE